MENVMICTQSTCGDKTLAEEMHNPDIHWRSVKR